MPSRVPLPYLSKEERRARLAAMGLDEQLDPLPLTPEEKQAASNPSEVDPRYTQEKPPMESPLVPAGLTKLAAALAAILGFAAAYAPKLAFLPGWVPFLLWALACVAALLAGIALPSFQGVAPTVPVVLVPILLAASTGLAALASAMVPGTAQTLVMFLAVVAAALGGKALPQPQAPDAPALKR